jgi:hypothetical protein
VEISESEVPAQAVPGVGAGQITHARGLRTKPRTAAVGRGAAWPTRPGGGGRPRAGLPGGNAERQRVGPGWLDRSGRDRANTRAEAPAEQRPSHTSRTRPGTQTVHALLDQGCSRKHVERAWEKVTKNRGSAGIDEVTMAVLARRQGSDLALLHRRLRDGT